MDDGGDAAKESANPLGVPGEWVPDAAATETERDGAAHPKEPR